MPTLCVVAIQLVEFGVNAVYFANQTATVRHLFWHVIKVVPLLLVAPAIAASERSLRQL